MNKLEELFYQKYANANTKIVRDFTHQIDWSNRLIGIKGSRGIGKTTLIIQYIKKHFKPTKEVLYVSLDDIYFSKNSFYELADSFYKKGGKFLAVDEVHRYPNWAIELKNIYDNMPLLKIVFTGSSLLHLQHSKADLSRRAVMYNMPGLSFREFLLFETKTEFKRYTLDEIIGNHTQIAVDVVTKLKPLAYFNDYLNYGYYPFYLENKQSFHLKLSEIILTILEVDITQFASIQVSNIVYLKKLLVVISNSVPFKPNMNSLSERTGISLNTMKAYLKLLHDAELLQLLYVKEKGINSLNKPEKIYLANTNLIYNQGNSSSNIGNIRETFFFNQVRVKNSVTASKQADFMINDKYTIEIGGKNKTNKQIKNLNEAFIVKDDIEIGSNNTIPLWLFGFLN
ncbi:MAG: AAA family ATPase [Flavobacteriales bacterium]|nr:AAA family ATPase [Flavobacteriales bacterium]